MFCGAVWCHSWNSSGRKKSPVSNWSAQVHQHFFFLKNKVMTLSWSVGWGDEPPPCAMQVFLFSRSVVLHNRPTEKGGLISLQYDSPRLFSDLSCVTCCKNISEKKSHPTFRCCLDHSVSQLTQMPVLILTWAITSVAMSQLQFLAK